MIWSVHEGRGKKPFLSTKGHEGPRRATKDHEEHLCKGIIWSVREGRGRKSFLSTKGREGQRRKPLQGHVLVYPRRASENNFFCPRRATKDHEKNPFKIIIWSVLEGPRREPFLVDADHGRRSRESREKRSDSARRRPVFCHIVSSLIQMSTEPGKHRWIGDRG